MSVPKVHPQTSLMKKIVGLVRGSFAGLTAAGESRRELPVISPHPLRPAEDLSVQTSASVMKKRAREDSTSGPAPKHEINHASDTPQIVSQPPQVNEDSSWISPKIIEEMTYLAKNKKKLDILTARRSRLELHAAKRGERVIRLDEQIKSTQDAGAAHSDTANELQEMVNKALKAFEESARRVYELNKRIDIFQLNDKTNRNSIERELNRILAEQGYHFDTPATDSEGPQNSSTRSSKRPRIEPELIESPVEREPDPDAEEKRAAVARLEEAELEYREARYQFANRSELDRESFEQWQRAVADARCSVTRTELDLQCCYRYGRLGNDLVEAELNRSRAAVEVMVLGAHSIAYTQTSKFVDHPADAEGLLEEAEQALSTLDAGKIEGWLENIQSDAAAEQLVEVDAEADEWDLQSLQYGESCNGVAEPRTKLTLKRWNWAREERWADMKEQLRTNPGLPNGEDGEQVSKSVDGGEAPDPSVLIG